MKPLAALCVAVFALAAGACASGATKLAASCTGNQLTGTFKVVRGSAGAGNIVYRLRVKNMTAAICGVTGLPRLTLLDSAGKKLPTKTLSSATVTFACM